jgi:CHAD domain-containing protein
VFKSVLPAEDAAWINGEARWLIQNLGPARDWDVFLTELLPPLQAAGNGNGDLAILAAAADEVRGRGYVQAREALRSSRYTAFVLELGRWIERAGWRGADASPRFEEPITDYACHLLRKRHKRALVAGRDFERLSDEERHRLRITLKKLRYTSEFFESLYPKNKTRPYLKALKSLLDELGHLNDVVVAKELLDSLHDRSAGNEPDAMRAAAGMVVGWYAHAVAIARPDIDRRWKAFAAAEPFWSRAQPGGWR